MHCYLEIVSKNFPLLFTFGWSCANIEDEDDGILKSLILIMLETDSNRIELGLMNVDL